MRPIPSLVRYRTSGVCEIVGIEEKKFGTATQQYYVLKPLRSPASTVFVPIGNEQLEGAMQPLLTREQIFALMRDIPACAALAEENPRVRKERFAAIINGGEHRELLALICGVRQQREQLQQEGKKLRVADDAAMKRAEALLNDEFSVVLDIPPNQVEAYIRQQQNAEKR